jgi:predicted RNase H-like nuclease (RuvC/YqgF family)
MIAAKRVLPTRREHVQNSFHQLPDSAESSDVEEERRMESEIFEVEPTQTSTRIKGVPLTDPQQLQVLLSKVMKENSQKDEEIKGLRRQLLEDANLNDQLSLHFHSIDDETKHKKIRELAKRLKNLTVAFERERTRNKQLETQLAGMENKKETISIDPDISKLQSELRSVKEKHAIVSKINKGHQKNRR